MTSDRLERLADVDDLVPEIAAIAAAEVLGEPIPTEDVDLGLVAVRLRRRVYALAFREWRERRPSSKGWRQPEELREIARYREAFEETVVDELNLALARRSGDED